MQPGLIDSVLRDLGLLHDNPHKDEHPVKHKFTPASSILHPDPDSLPHEETWHYHSVVGKLNFIAANTRPDISLAVHQCTKYSNQPCFLHKKAVKHIGRYLYLTQTQGLILHPQPDHSLNAYADADFAGCWYQAYSHLHDSVLSWTGYVLVYCRCPISWTSKLQMEIALSTTEAEYQALSMCMWDLLPLWTLIQELAMHSFIDQMYLHGSQLFSSTLTLQVYGDNQSCLTITTTDTNRPWTKHLAIKCYHFWVQVLKGIIQVVKVHTNDNWVDIFTKPLSWVKFEWLCLLLMLW